MTDTRNNERRATVPFIVCYPRSGSTLLRLMLDSHPDLAIPPETHFNQIFIELAAAESQLADPRRSLFESLLASPRWSDFKLDARVLWNRLNDLQDQFTIAEGLRTFYRLYSTSQRKTRWGDKTPGHILAISAIGKLLPEANFIHLIRDGRDVAASMRHLWWGPGNDIEALARDWVHRLTLAREASRAFPHRYFEIRYEDLVSDPELNLRRISAAIDLSFDSAMLRHHERAASRIAELGEIRHSDGRILATRDDHQQLHRRTFLPPNTERIGRWRDELTPSEVIIFEAVAKSLLVEFGYLLAGERQNL
jgi:hypothetical protein